MTKIDKIRPKKARNLNILGLLESKREPNYPQNGLRLGVVKKQHLSNFKKY